MTTSRSARRVGALLFPLLAISALAGAAFASEGSSGGSSSPFIASAHENLDFTVTLPLHVGTSGGQKVYYIVTDTSNGNVSQAAGANTSQKLANAAGSGAVQKVTLTADGTVDFPATVNFSAQQRIVVPGPQGFPPVTAQPPRSATPDTAR